MAPASLQLVPPLAALAILSAAAFAAEGARDCAALFAEPLPAAPRSLPPGYQFLARRRAVRLLEVGARRIEEARAVVGSPDAAPAGRAAAFRFLLAAREQGYATAPGGIELILSLARAATAPEEREILMQALAEHGSPVVRDTLAEIGLHFGEPGQLPPIAAEALLESCARWGRTPEAVMALDSLPDRTLAALAAPPRFRPEAYPGSAHWSRAGRRARGQLYLALLYREIRSELLPTLEHYRRHGDASALEAYLARELRIDGEDGLRDEETRSKVSWDERLRVDRFEDPLLRAYDRLVTHRLLPAVLGDRPSALPRPVEAAYRAAVATAVLTDWMLRQSELWDQYTRRKGTLFGSSRKRFWEGVLEILAPISGLSQGRPSPVLGFLHGAGTAGDPPVSPPLAAFLTSRSLSDLRARLGRRLVDPETVERVSFEELLPLSPSAP